jgi:hypothetical protein
MEQRDYLLREIEKIGAIMNAIRQKIVGGKGNLAITLEHQIEYAKGQLFNGINFDLETFLDLDLEKSIEYISHFEGFSIENMEVFAECFSEIGLNEDCDNPKKYLEKALQLYNLCDLRSKTYSFGRETKIYNIKNALQLA